MAPSRRQLGHAPRRASVVGAGSFGTAVALLLERAGVRTTLLCRTEEQARLLGDARENKRYLPGVELPAALKVRAFGAHDDQFRRPDLVFLAVPSKGLGEAVAEASRSRLAMKPSGTSGLSEQAAMKAAAVDRLMPARQ